MLSLYPYQQNLVAACAEKLSQGHKKIIAQLPTGGGKTAAFSAISARFIDRNPGGRVLILVHRIELLKQARRSLLKFNNIVSHPIQAGGKWLPDAPVYVGMIESVYRRLPKLPPIGLVIIDEAHLNTFDKIHQQFEDAYFIGFTATPLSANKKKPLKNIYSDIVAGPQIAELIAAGALCQNITISPREVVSRSELAIKNGEFDMEGMARSFSQPKYIREVVKAYTKHAPATKCLVFNVNIEHSQLVAQAFRDAGYSAAHLDGTETPYRRAQVLAWFHDTPGAILCNCAILTAGFDEPGLETIIVNRATMSMPLWLQITGRGSRPTEFKKLFTIIDMGGNAIIHGDWNADRNWIEIFHNPKKPKERDQVAPVKSCDNCEALIPAGCRQCPYCGYQYPARDQEIEEELGEFVVVTRGIDVDRLIQENAHHKEYYTFFAIGRDIAIALLEKLGPKGLTDEKAEFALQEYFKVAQKWCAARGKHWGRWYGERAKETLFAELQDRFKGWTRPELREPEPEAPLPAPPPPPDPPRQNDWFPAAIENLQRISTL